MGLILQQNNLSKRQLNQENINRFIGEILHFTLESLLVCEKDIKLLFHDKEFFTQKISFYLKKALALYQEPIFRKEEIEEKARETLLKLFEEIEFKKLIFKALRQAKNIYSEVEGFLLDEEKKDIKMVRPDLIIKCSSGWVIFEFKLHQASDLRDEDQLKGYVSLLQKLYPNVNISAYLIVLEPFNIVEINRKDASNSINSCQLSLFENLC
ncbi:hypothetical protein [Thermodesulfobacterium thermophilum]|uniref:hypothetical protein n=1 Tax=Thermodesulfobacterium thermophilum TaxID=886 RepID=UPI0004907123|nr:hypothetical protein [Thermodesulfobacterium thermophilum]